METVICNMEGINIPIPKRSYIDSHGITLCCIILNEEKEILEFLSYHKPYFKSIIMIDLGSVDRTVELATPLVDVMLKYDNDGHHSNAINRMLEKVTSDWVCLLDCDERLERKTLDNLYGMINQDIYDCYSFPRRNSIDGRPDPIRPLDYQDRLFRSYCRVIRPIHQEVVGYKNKKTIVMEDGNYIVHSKSFARHQIRNKGYSIYEYKFFHEMGGPGAQTENTFNVVYPHLKWEIIIGK